ncbi:MAG: FG-GAP repeat protein [Marinicella pacifica]
MIKSSTQIVLIIFFLIFSFNGMAADDFDQQRPDNVGDKKWSSLKAAVQEAKLTASDGAQYDSFGQSVSLSGNRALVGAHNDDDKGSNSGSAYIFDFDGTNWIQSKKLTADDGAADDLFGSAVSLSGNRALVGAPHDGDDGPYSGSVYVFEFDGVSWSQTQKLTADNAAGNDMFGLSVSLHGERALVGTGNADFNGINSGLAYVFDFNGGSWTQSQKLSANDGSAGDSFGDSVSLFGDRALIGARGDDDKGSSSGSAYVFDFNGSNWSQSQKLTASDGTDSDYFGTSVSLFNNQILIGSPGDDDKGSSSGSAYIFEFNNNNWSQSQKIVAVDGADGDQFGHSVNLSGNRAFLGALNDDDNGSNSGSAYVFEYNGSDWIQSQKIIDVNGEHGDTFGWSVSSSGNRLLIGSRGDNDQGSAFVFYSIAQYEIYIQVTGLAGDMVSFSNGSDTLNMSSDGTQAISLLDDGSAFDVNITSQPTSPNQVCSFDNADSGTLNGTNYTVNVSCVTTQYSIGGIVSDLATGNEVVLQNNGGDDLTVSANDSFTFATNLDDESAYDVTVLTQPTSPNQQCTVTQGTGTLAGANVSHVQVNCVTDVHTIGGTVSGLANGNFVTLLMNSGDEYLVVSDNTGFTFLNALADGSAYEVRVLSNPTTPNQNCTLTNDSGTLQGANVTDIEVNCTINQYMIGGYVNGLIPDNYMVLQNNLTDDLIIRNKGAFAFPTPLDDQQSYDVTIQTQPNDPIQSCELINETGSLTGSDIENVFVVCEFGDDLIYRHGFDTPEAISRALWEPEE